MLSPQLEAHLPLAESSGNSLWKVANTHFGRHLCAIHTYLRMDLTVNADLERKIRYSYS